MSESYPPDNTLNALSGTSDSETGLEYIPTGQSPYYTSFYKMLYRLLDSARRANDLRVYKDGDLTFGVRAGKYLNADTAVNYSGASQQSLTDDATNYIYLTASGTLTVNTTGFPAPSVTAHIPLATIVTASGIYDFSDIADYRGRSIFQVCGASDVNLNITAGAESADKRTITIQARDGADNDISKQFLIRVWACTTDYGAPNATGNTVAVEAGITYETETTDAAYKIISDSTGKVEIGLTVSGAASRYVLAEIDGQIYSSGEITWAA